MKFYLLEGDLLDKKFLNAIFVDHNPNIVVNLAAQAGGFSLKNPDAYLKANIQDS